MPDCETWIPPGGREGRWKGVGYLSRLVVFWVGKGLEADTGA